MVQPEQRRGARRPLYRQPHLPPPVATGGPCTGAHAHPRWSVACALPRRRLRGVYAAAARFGRPPYILAQSPLDVSPCPHGVHAHDDAHDVLAAALRALQRALLRATPPSFSELFSELLFSELLFSELLRATLLRATPPIHNALARPGRLRDLHPHPAALPVRALHRARSSRTLVV